MDESFKGILSFYHFDEIFSPEPFFSIYRKGKENVLKHAELECQRL